MKRMSKQIEKKNIFRGHGIRRTSKSFLKKVAYKTVPLIASRLDFHRIKRTILDVYGYDLNKTSTARLRVAIITRSARQRPTSSVYIRLISPLTLLAKRGKVSIELFGEDTVKLPPHINIAIVQRTAFDTVEAARKFIEYAKTNSIAIVVDTDDSFRFISKAHPEYALQAQRTRALDEIMKAASVVWFSTQVLYDSHDELGERRRLLANSVDERLWRITPKAYRSPSKKSPLQIVYMGTATHGEDFEFVLRALDEVARQQPGSFKLTVMGIADDIPNRPWIKGIGGAPYIPFVQRFIHEGPFDVGLAPLVNSHFNNSKSDIKCLDYLMPGITPLVSDVLPYNTSDLSPYITIVKNNKKAWVDALTDQISRKDVNRKNRAKRVKKALSYIKKHRSVEIVAKQMLKELQAISRN
jgi:glycosyltransferase involved in cell wall biosynthesis